MTKLKITNREDRADYRVFLKKILRNHGGAVTPGERTWNLERRVESVQGE